MGRSAQFLIKRGDMLESLRLAEANRAVTLWRRYMLLEFIEGKRSWKEVLAYYHQ